MATMISEIYDAFKEANVSEEKARAAAEAIATYDRQFSSIRGDIAEVRSDIKLLRWMSGANFALTFAVFVRLFIH